MWSFNPSLYGKRVLNFNNNTLEGYRTSSRSWTHSSEKVNSESMPEFNFYDESFFVNERNYLLVSEEESEDAEVLILKDTADEQANESIYELVEDENELTAVLKVFEELMDEEE